MNGFLRTIALTVSMIGATAAMANPTGSKLLPGLDTYHFEITTDSPEAQAWFNQGLVLMYGFNHGEAIRSFREAAARDPEAAMPWWGVAYAHGMHINMPVMTDAQWQASHDAVQKALARLDEETELEAMLVKAVAARTAWPAPPEQRPYDEAFATAMSEVYAAYPNNPDVAAMYVESMMNLQPWNYWTEAKEPHLRAAEIVDVLERALALRPAHPQLCHLYIHAMEAGPAPEKAEKAADDLVERVPGAGHLQHMPSHLYARVGRYADAVKVNERAVAADDTFFTVGTDPGAYYIYHGHNLHFLAFAAMMEGQYEIALAAARRLETAFPEPALDQFAFLVEGIVPTTYHVFIRFGKWEEVLAEKAPPKKRPVMLAVHHYARGIAHAALGQTRKAKREIARFERQTQAIPDGWYVFSNKISDVLPIAHAMLAGELAYREGRLQDAWTALEAAIAAEDKLAYDEPPGWMIPVRHAMGALLMEAGEYARAESLYREDQEDHPGNGWSLLGLQQALAAQARDEEAAQYAKALDRAWQRVTERPTSSCLCAPGKI